VDVEELVARECIRDTIAAYTHSGDRGRIADLAALFCADGVLEVAGGQTARGPAAIEAMLSGVVGRPRSGGGPPVRMIRHHVSNVRITDYTPERANAVSYFLVLTDTGVDHWGRYRDVLVPRGDRWLFAHRVVRVDAHVPDSWFAGSDVRRR
jgi:hypothetical protein